MITILRLEDSKYSDVFYELVVETNLNEPEMKKKDRGYCRKIRLKRRNLIKVIPFNTMTIYL